jgi:hypothetical protein
MWPLYPREIDPMRIVQEAVRVPGPVWTAAENLASTGIRSPNRWTSQSETGGRRAFRLTQAVQFILNRYKYEQDRKYTYNATMRRVRVTIVAAVTQ